MRNLPEVAARVGRGARTRASIPGSIRIVEWAAAGQAVLAGATAAVWFSAAADITPSGDDDWSSISRLIFTVGAVVAVAAIFAIGLPAALLRRHGPAPRIFLIVAECVIAVPFATVLPSLLNATGQDTTKVIASAYVALGVVCVISASRPTARGFTAGNWTQS